MIIRRLDSWPFERQLNEFTELDRLRRDLGLLLNGRQSRNSGEEPSAGVFPLFHVTHDPDNFYIRSEVSGMILDKLDLSVTGRTVSISGEWTIPSGHL